MSSIEPQVSEFMVHRIVALIASQFHTMGGGKATPGNPISAAMADRPLSFALGVDVESVVRFVLSESA